MLIDSLALCNLEIRFDVLIVIGVQLAPEQFNVRLPPTVSNTFTSLIVS